MRTTRLLFLSILSVFILISISSAQQNITWVNQTKVSLNIDQSLTGNGIENRWSAGAASSQRFTGEAYISVTLSDIAGKYFVGLTKPNVSVHYGSIKFGFYMESGKLSTWESSRQTKVIGNFAVGDQIIISRKGNFIFYYHNGEEVYKSMSIYSSTLVADCSFKTKSATLGPCFFDTRAFSPLLFTLPVDPSTTADDNPPNSSNSTSNNSSLNVEWQGFTKASIFGSSGVQGNGIKTNGIQVQDRTKP